MFFRGKYIRKIARISLMCLAVLFIATSVSVTRALIEDTGLSTSGKLANWAREHHLGSIVDFAESVRYRNPPKDKDVSELNAAPASASSTTLQPPDFVPENLRVIFDPALEFEGQWRVARLVNGVPAVWTTGIRPSQKYRAMIATHVLVDQSALRAVLHNGTEVPGGKDWAYGNKIDSEDLSKVAFAFNGGFRREHSGGGYFTEGREIWPLKDGVASLAIDSDGQIHIGRWNVDISSYGIAGKQWISVRQNLRLLVDDGNLPPDLSHGYWGGGGKGEIYIMRSAVCVRFDGRLVFTIMGLTDPIELATAMRDVGCQYAMQLDQNESYPRGYIFNNGVPSEIDNRMWGHVDDFVRGYSRDFFVLMEP